MNADADRARLEAASWLVFLDDEPGDATRQAEFRAWLDAAPVNAAAWRSVARTDDLLALAADHGSRPAAPSGGTRTLPGVFSRWRPVAAAIAIAACLLMVFVPTLTLHLQADYLTGTAQLETLQLDDGSTVRLGPDLSLIHI